MPHKRLPKLTVVVVAVEFLLLDLDWSFDELDFGFALPDLGVNFDSAVVVVVVAVVGL